MAFPYDKSGAGVGLGYGEGTRHPWLGVHAWSVPLQKAVDVLTAHLGDNKYYPIPCSPVFV